jgi:hypothetical protein
MACNFSNEIDTQSIMVSMKMRVAATILLFVSINMFAQTNDNAKNANKTAPGSNSPTPVPSPIPTAAGNGSQNQAISPQSDMRKASEGVHAVQPVTIGTAQDNPLGVSSTKDYWDKALVLGTLLLVVVGVFGVRYAIKTLKAIDKQAESMDGQLKEMKAARALTRKQVQYIVNAERAWVMGELDWFGKRANIVESTTKGKESTTAFVKLTCINDGKSPAWIDQVYSHLEIIGRDSFRDERGERDRQKLGINGPWGRLGREKRNLAAWN